MSSTKIFGAPAFALLVSLAVSGALAGGACGGGGPSDQSTTSTTGTGGGSDCYTAPTSYVEIINACTNAQAIDLTPVLPLLQADGGLPPLP